MRVISLVLITICLMAGCDKLKQELVLSEPEAERFHDFMKGEQLLKGEKLNE